MALAAALALTGLTALAIVGALALATWVDTELDAFRRERPLYVRGA
jgi:hypothetical protein